MELTRIIYLKGELENECIATNEISEIEEAFAKVPDDYLSDERENAMASDMLDVLESRVSTIEKTIYDWVFDNFGESEANDPSWNIGSLANELNSLTLERDGEDYKLSYLLDGSNDEVGNDNEISNEC